MSQNHFSKKKILKDEIIQCRKWNLKSNWRKHRIAFITVGLSQNSPKKPEITKAKLISDHPNTLVLQFPDCPSSKHSSLAIHLVVFNNCKFSIISISIRPEIPLVTFTPTTLWNHQVLQTIDSTIFSLTLTSLISSLALLTSLKL